MKAFSCYFICETNIKIGSDSLKKIKSLFLMFLVIAMVIGILPDIKAKADSKDVLDSSSQVLSDIEGKEELEINGEKYTYTYDFTDPAVNRVNVTDENGVEIKFEYDTKTNTLYKNNELDFNLVKEEDGIISPSDASTMKIPPGGKYMGKYNYKYNLKGVSVGVATAAIAAVSKAPYNVILSIVSFLAGTQTTAYYTVFQYRYAFKCNAYPYANRTKFYEDSSRKKVLRTADSAKFFGSRPTPASCQP